MKSPTLLLMLLLGVTAMGACARRAETPAADPAAANAEAKRTERLARFGPDALAEGVMWRENGLGYRILNDGKPPHPGLGTPVRLTYAGRLKDGAVFDRTDKPVDFTIGGTIPGLSAGLQMLGTGGKAVFFIPPALGYGGRQVMGIPPNSGLIFEVEVVAVNP